MGQADSHVTNGLSHQDFFDLEQAQDQRYEYLAGEVFAMVGGSESHALISANCLALLSIKLRDQPCRAYGADMKLYIAAANKFCYPDVMVLCGEGGRGGNYVEAPALIVEVLSDSTESYDRGLKFEHYRAIPDLRHYLLLSQRRLHAELYTRTDPASWRFQEASGETSALVLDAWGVQLPLSELYRNVELGGGEQPLVENRE